MRKPRFTKRRLGAVAVWGVLLFVAIQFVPFGWNRSPPPATAQAPWPSERAATIATRACADCHSSETRWPWYSYVAPMSWLVVADVREGRDELNLSTWDRDDGEADDAVETIVEGSMPPLRYVLLHPDARLSDDEQRVLIDAFEQMDELQD